MSCAKEDNVALIQQLTMDIDSDSDSDSEIKPLAPPQIDAPSVRPQIIVTPRKMADAIESVKADVLAKHNKTSLFECVPAASSDNNPLPNAFAVFDMNSGASTSSGSVASLAGEGSSSSVIAQGGSSASGSPSKSVIVRAGPSVCVVKICFFCLTPPRRIL